MTTPDKNPDHDPVQSAWNIHTAIQTWTTSVDSKASYVLTIETAIVVGIVALAGDDHRLSHLHGKLQNGLFYLGVGLLVGALVFAAIVIRPRLRSWTLNDESKDSYIYFGHINRGWNSSTLENALRERDLLPVLSRQIVRTSEVAWRKHRRLQTSMTLAIVGTALVAYAAAITG